MTIEEAVDRLIADRNAMRLELDQLQIRLHVRSVIMNFLLHRTLELSNLSEDHWNSHLELMRKGLTDEFKRFEGEDKQVLEAAVEEFDKWVIGAKRSNVFRVIPGGKDEV